MVKIRKVPHPDLGSCLIIGGDLSIFGEELECSEWDIIAKCRSRGPRGTKAISLMAGWASEQSGGGGSSPKRARKPHERVSIWHLGCQHGEEGSWHVPKLWGSKEVMKVLYYLVVLKNKPCLILAGLGWMIGLCPQAAGLLGSGKDCRYQGSWKVRGRPH